MSYYHPDSKPSWPFIFILIIILVVVWLIETGVSTNVYNNGICRNCGGTYIYQQAVGRGHYVHYLYKCNKCNDIIETNTYFKGNENQNGM